MGYNSVIVVMNDSIHAIADDGGNFGVGLLRAVKAFGFNGSRRSRLDHEVSAGGHVNAAEVISCDHAGANQLVLVGQNSGRRIGVDDTRLDEDIALLEAELKWLRRQRKTRTATPEAAE